MIPAAAAQRLRSTVQWVVAAQHGPSAVIQTMLWRMFIIALNLLNGVIVARNLGAMGRGIQAALMLWPQLIAFLLTLGVSNAILYHARKHQHERNELFSTVLLFAVGLGSLATIIGIIGLPSWLHNYDTVTIRTAQMLMVYAPFSMLGIFVSAILESELNFSASNMLRYGPTIFTTAMLATLAIVHGITPLSSSLSYLIPSTIVTLVATALALKRFAFTLQGIPRASRRLLGYGMRVYGSSVLNTFGQQIDQLLVVGLLSATELGIYTVALSASRVLNIFQTSLSIVLFPRTAGLEDRHVTDLVGRLARLTLLATSAGGIMLILALPLLLGKLYGADFLAGVRVSQILTIEVILASTTTILTQTFLATNRPGIVTFLQMIGFGLAVPLMLVLIPKLGLVGAALSLLISTTMRLLSALACYPLVLKLSAPGLVPTRDDMNYLVSAFTRRLRGATA